MSCEHELQKKKTLINPTKLDFELSLKMKVSSRQVNKYDFS